MGDSEKISGKKIFDLLEQIKNDHIIVNIHVIGTDFEGLSVILDVSDGENPSFFIDYPGKVNSAALISAGKKCYFEFSDENKIKYSFKTTIDGILGERIKFVFPEFIERSQRRKTFRIPVPSGTRLTFTNKDRHFALDTINVSEGGLLASIKAMHHDEDILFMGSKLHKLSLFAELEGKIVNISINSAEILRLEKIKGIGRINYGFKFIDIDQQNQYELKRFIYNCQRRDLKKRGGL